MTVKLVELALHNAGWFNQEGTVFVNATMPIFESRGGAPVGYCKNLPLLTTSMIAFIGNLIPVPFIFFFIGAIPKILEKYIILSKSIHEICDHASHKSKAIQKMEYIGLMSYICFPLLGTGAWTGSLVADNLQMDLMKAFCAIVFGVLLVLVIMLECSYEVSHQVGS